MAQSASDIKDARVGTLWSYIRLDTSVFLLRAGCGTSASCSREGRTPLLEESSNGFAMIARVKAKLLTGKRCVQDEVD